MSTQPLLTGLDVGTTSIKALIFTPDGQVIARASTPTPVHSPQLGWAVYDPEALWQAAASVLREACAAVDSRRIVSVAIASMGEAGVPLDADNAPTYPAIAWFDPRSQPQAEWLEQQIGRDALFAVTGLSLLPIFSLCKLLWLRQNELEAFRRTVRWLNIADYIAFRLCGEQATDCSLASRTLALDIAQGRWSDSILAEVGIPAGLFAPLCASGTRLGTVTPHASEETGLPTSAQVAAGGHDHVCGALAAGVTAPGVLLNSMGTSETMFLSLERPLRDPVVGREGFTQGAHVVPGLYYVLGALYTSGGSVEWFKTTLADNTDYGALIAAAESVPPGSEGVCFLPHLQLASPPYDDPGARGAFIGLGSEIDRAALFRAVLEGICCDTRLILETLLGYPDVPDPRTVYVIGGSTRNRLLMHIKASLLNRSLHIADVGDATSLGAALLGGVGAGIYPDAAAAQAALRRQITIVEPLPDDVPRYEHLYGQVYRRLYPAISPLHRALEPLRHRGV